MNFSKTNNPVINVQQQQQHFLVACADKKTTSQKNTNTIQFE
ncbi:hypothetical protein Bhyg_16911, partial [Pseudolycoriella hygida]